MAQAARSGLLKDGENVIAAEVHQINHGSSVLHFELEVRAGVVGASYLRTLRQTGADGRPPAGRHDAHDAADDAHANFPAAVVNFPARPEPARF